MKYKIIFILILILFLIPSVWSLLLPGFFESDDGEWMVIRFSAFYQALADGQFPVRFLGRLNFGYGYPVANFLYPGFMYLAVPFQILGIGFVNSIKLVLIFSMLGGGLFTFFWLSKLFDKKSALVGSIFYTYIPYHLFDLYKRGSVGEILSLAIASFVLWSIEDKNRIAIALGIFLLAISHNSLFLLFIPLLFVYGIIRKKLNFKESVLIFGLGLLMSSFFTIPAILELSYTSFSTIKISNISEYFSSIDLIGISNISVVIGSLLLIILRKAKKSRETYFFIIISVVSIFLSLNISNIIWNFIPSSLFQFPFRMLSYSVISGAFLSAFIINNLKEKKITVLALLISLIFLSSLNFIFPSKRIYKEDGLYSTNEATTTVKDEYMPKWVKDKPTVHFDKKTEIVKGSGEISNLVYNSKHIIFTLKSNTDSTVRINTIYYPGWKAEVNKVRSEIDYSNSKGVMEIDVPKGENKIKLDFEESELRIFSNLLSVVGFILLFFAGGYFLLKRKKK